MNKLLLPDYQLKALSQITVSRVFYERARESFPKIFQNPGYTALFWYLLFGTHHDRFTHRLLLSSKLLALFEGRSPVNTQAENFLIGFRYRLPEGSVLQWSHFNYKTDKCRQLIEFSLGDFDEIVSAERMHEWRESGRVYLDGAAYSTKRQIINRRIARREAFNGDFQCDQAQYIGNYLNSLPPHLFNRVVAENLIDAEAEAYALKPESMESQLRLLRFIETNQQPFYHSGKNSVRLFTNPSIANLQRDVRKALTHGWTEGDLRYSQLAICAKLWKMKIIEEFLREGKSFWIELFRDLGVKESEVAKVKDILKKRLYSICYGMTSRKVHRIGAWELYEAGFSPNIIDKFLEHHFIKAIFYYRAIEAERIRKERGAYDAYGNWLPLSKKRWARDIMATVAQSWEMKLIFPVFLMASHTRDFTITLFQHDGFSINFRQRKEEWKKKLEGVVSNKVKELGIYTGLEWKDN
jgi:hypothetical protein